MNEIQSFANRIASEFSPQRIILFGSHAGGVPAPDSDVDLMVVTDYTGKSWELAARIRTLLRPGFAVDVLVRSPRQIRERLDLGDPFIQEITQRGRVLYEARHR